MAAERNDRPDLPRSPRGWQVSDLHRSLFPGGPRAFMVVRPEGQFVFGLSIEPGVTGPPPHVAVITSFGRAALTPTNRNALAPLEQAAAQEEVARYILTYPGLFWREPIEDVVFAAGDGKRVEIF